MSFALGVLRGLGVKVSEESLRRFVDTALSWIVDRGRDDFTKSLTQFISRVNDAWQYLNDERCVETVNEVASEWGMDAESFRNCISNWRNLTAGR